MIDFHDFERDGQGRPYPNDTPEQLRARSEDLRERIAARQRGEWPTFRLPTKGDVGGEIPGG
jgi:hypothetical protein